MTDYDIAHVSLRGDRGQNQDRLGWRVRDQNLLMVLADGMGGHPRGELAAAAAVQCVMRMFQDAAPSRAGSAGFLHDALLEAHSEVVAQGRAVSPPVAPHTTCIAARVARGGVDWAYVGDSRLYLLRNDGTWLRTRDHNAAEELYQLGSISAEERRHHPLRHQVTRALGGDQTPTPESGSGPGLAPGDLLLLCSDGLLALPESRILAGLRDTAPLGGILPALGAEAVRAAHPHSDNVSVLALRWR
ncbi:MAG: PP2C family protein-serine/threonine phosphatase [Gammaproteobacteria bacterium]|nr:protein phosphatase 2C domain-containing protein [Gammaproteobacteria bacterium]